MLTRILNKKVAVHYELDQTRIRYLTNRCKNYHRVSGWTSKEMFSIHLVGKNLSRLASIIRSGKKVTFRSETLAPGDNIAMKDDSIYSGTATKISKDFTRFEIKLENLPQPKVIEESSLNSERSSHSAMNDSPIVHKDEETSKPTAIIVLPADISNSNLDDLTKSAKQAEPTKKAPVPKHDGPREDHKLPQILNKPPSSNSIVRHSIQKKSFATEQPEI